MQRATSWLLAIVGILFSACLASAADRMHMIIVQSVTVAGAGSDASSAMMIHDDWKRLTQTNGRLVKVVQDPRQGAREKVLAAFQQLGQVGERDVVVFYYTGHGAIDEDDGHFLQLDDNSRVTRTELRQKLRGLGGRLHVIVTDCCALVVPPRRHITAGLDPPEIAQRVVANLGRLFAVNGLVDINSSARDQIAWGTNSGGLFTREFKRILSTEQVDSWDGFTQSLKTATEASYAKFRERNINQGGRPDNLGESDLAEVQNQMSQTPEVYALEVKRDEVAVVPDPPRPPPQNLPLPQPPRGVVVERVFDGTTAMKLFLNGEQMKLEAGDRILTLNGRGIKNAEHFGEIIDQLGKGVAVTVAVEDTNTGKIIELRGRLDAGGGYRFGAKVNDVK
jgi:hypothetical protein